MGILVLTDFKVIEKKEGIKSYPTLVGQPWERKMKENISLEKYKIKLKGKGKNIVIPIDPKEGKPWEELDDSEAQIIHLYQIMQSNSDTVIPNNLGELDLGSPMFIGCNFDSNLYD